MVTLASRQIRNAAVTISSETLWLADHVACHLARLYRRADGGDPPLADTIRLTSSDAGTTNSPEDEPGGCPHRPVPSQGERTGRYTDDLQRTVFSVSPEFPGVFDLQRATPQWSNFKTHDTVHRDCCRLCCLTHVTRLRAQHIQSSWVSPDKGDISARPSWP